MVSGGETSCGPANPCHRAQHQNNVENGRAVAISAAGLPRALPSSDGMGMEHLGRSAYVGVDSDGRASNPLSLLARKFVDISLVSRSTTFSGHGRIGRAGLNADGGHTPAVGSEPVAPLPDHVGYAETSCAPGSSCGTAVRLGAFGVASAILASIASRIVGAPAIAAQVGAAIYLQQEQKGQEPL